MAQYYISLNRELTQEVQQLRMRIRDYQNLVRELRNENNELHSENLFMKSYLETFFKHFSEYSQKFSENFVDLLERGVKLKIPKREISIASTSSGISVKSSDRSSDGSPHSARTFRPSLSRTTTNLVAMEITNAGPETGNLLAPESKNGKSGNSNFNGPLIN
jgi:hypothetical protein